MSVRKIVGRISEEEKKEICVRIPTLEDVFVEYYFLHYSDVEQWGLEEWEKEREGFAKLEHRGKGIVFEEIIKPEILRIREIIKNEGLMRIMSNKCEFLYKNAIYKFDRYDYSDEELLLQILDLEDNERRKFERLKRKFELSQQMEKAPKRETIPEEVRVAVWRRDQGKCAKCGSRKNLEYDHIIPISKGGSNTVRNIELLCEECNRRKKDKIE